MRHRLIFCQLFGISSCTSMRVMNSNFVTSNQRTGRAASLVITGPSGVGKGTILSKFLTEMGGSQQFGFSCSHTTRSPRPGEINGVHYHFTTVEQMEQGIANNLFLEWANVHGNLYGTSFSSIRDVQERNKICLLDIDVQGVQKIKREYPNFAAHYVFIAPPSREILKERLAQRGTETDESLHRRTVNAIAELDYGLTPGNFDRIVINDDLDTACKEFQLIVNELYYKNSIS